jgi:predicted component of type VI protein secretion system
VRPAFLLPALLLLCLPLLAGSCGGSTSATTTTTVSARPTQKQFVSAANAVCVRSDRAIFRLGRLTRAPAGWGRTATAARRAVADMRKVTPAEGKDEGFQHLLALGQRLADQIQNVHDALVKRNYAKALEAQTSATAADTAIHRQAQKLGLTFCQQLLTNWPA